MSEPRIITVADGLRAQVLEVQVLPRTLPQLLGALRLSHLIAEPRVRGTRRACTDGEHEPQPWRTGVWQGRELRLSICPWCGSVEVRDVSLDILPGVQAGLGGPRRRSELLGWYSGKRPRGRTFM